MTVLEGILCVSQHGTVATGRRITKSVETEIFWVKLRPHDFYPARRVELKSMPSSMRKKIPKQILTKVHSYPHHILVQLFDQSSTWAAISSKNVIEFGTGFEQDIKRLPKMDRVSPKILKDLRRAYQDAIQFSHGKLGH